MRFIMPEILDKVEKKLKNKDKADEYYSQIANYFDAHELIGGEDSPAEKFKKRLIADGEEGFFNELVRLKIIKEEELGKNEWDSDIVRLVSF